MLLKPGVDISRLARPIRRVLCPLDSLFDKYKEELVITSTYGGNHLPCSLHYANLAIDIRLPKKNLKEIVTEIKDILGKDYDVVLERDHIHIEYDPKGD